MVPGGGFVPEGPHAESAQITQPPIARTRRERDPCDAPPGSLMMGQNIDWDSRWQYSS